MKIFALDAHPGTEGTSKDLLAAYLDGAKNADIERMNLRDMAFDPILHEGYRNRQEWEPDLKRAMDAIQACNHFVLAFPMWWGAQPALLKGFFDRTFLPGVAFKFHEGKQMQERLLTGRSATVLMTGDTPGWFLRWRYGNPIFNQTKGQILGFCGFKPVRMRYFGPVRLQRQETFDKWRSDAKSLGELETQRR